jgi:ABC-type lipoprotein release transport system permease subunit
VPALESVLGTRLWDKNVYLISELPSQIHAADVTMITIMSFVLALGGDDLSELARSARAAG